MTITDDEVGEQDYTRHISDTERDYGDAGIYLGTRILSNEDLWTGDSGLHVKDLMEAGLIRSSIPRDLMDVPPTPIPIIARDGRWLMPFQEPIEEEII